LKDVICINFVRGICKGDLRNCNHYFPHEPYTLIGGVSCKETIYFNEEPSVKRLRYCCQSNTRCVEIGSLEYEMLRIIKEHEEGNDDKNKLYR
jgi:hypothetical protein